jgi:hypothetical protein
VDCQLIRRSLPAPEAATPRGDSTAARAVRWRWREPSDGGGEISAARLKDPYEILLAVDVMQAEPEVARWYSGYLKSSTGSLAPAILAVLDVDG